MGFTLLELIIVLSLVSLIGGIVVVPAYYQWLADLRLEMKSRELLTALRFARNKALYYHRTVTLCKSNDHQTCGGQWEKGWLVVIDNNSDDFKSQRRVLRHYNGLDSKQSLVWKGARAMEEIKFNALGSSVGYNGRFVLCHKPPTRRKIAWIIQVSHTGRPRLEVSRDISQCGV